MSLSVVQPKNSDDYIDSSVQDVYSQRDAWLSLSIDDRIQFLEEIKRCTEEVAEEWVPLAVEGKEIPAGSPLSGEEWLSGPYAVLAACNGLIETLTRAKTGDLVDHLPQRRLSDGQLAVQVVPHSLWDHLLLSGVSIEVWMRQGVTSENLNDHTASLYHQRVEDRKAGAALVLGAGNIASIAPLDCLYKLFAEFKVVVLKLNPVNDYLYDVLQKALKPLIDSSFLRIVTGDGAAGAKLAMHPLIDEIHITGAGSTHDAIVWGVGDVGEGNKRANTPINDRPISSELGAVCPTIVVPGPWSKADIKFQAEHIATQKLHNSGFNCVAMQELIVSETWALSRQFIGAIEDAIEKAPGRGLYYPGAEERLANFVEGAPSLRRVRREMGGDCFVLLDPSDQACSNEVFGPAFSLQTLDELDPERFLEKSIAFANEKLHGTLGANIIIHPQTLKKIGKRRFDELLQTLRYGTIAVNAWTGVGFLTAQATWGAFPGHTLDDVQSGIGVVHNSLLFDRPERTVVTAPFRPFPRGLLSGKLSLLPKPPWFVSNRRADRLGRRLTEFQASPSLSKIPGIFIEALRG